MGCIKEMIVLLACIGSTFAEGSGIDCYKCDYATCDLTCNEANDWCDGDHACLIHVTSDPSYKNDLISKSCNESCADYARNKWHCADKYCDDRWYCCDTGDFCNENTPKRPFPPDPTAPKGPKGYPGPPGNAGVAGNTGPKGPDGGEGPKGDVGNNGPRGDMGDTGAKGLRGPQGPPGDAGDEGRAGPPGDPGLPGPPGHFGHRGFKGNKGPDGDEGPGGVLGFPGPNGVQGSRGATGEKGYKGVGVQGDPGEVGWPGAPGAPLAGIKGAKGVKGDEGPAGAEGDDGDPGTCTCNVNVTIVCFTVFVDFVFNRGPGETEPEPLFIDGAIYYQNTLDLGIIFGVGVPVMRFDVPVQGLYVFYIEAIASCNFATSIEVYFQSGGFGPFTLIGFTGRSVNNDGQDISIGVFTFVICLKRFDVIVLSAQSPALPDLSDPMDPWENNSPTFVQWTGCLKHAGECDCDPPPAAVRES